MARREYFRTKGGDNAAGLIRNFELNMPPGNVAVVSDFGISSEDHFDALRWEWQQGRLDKDKLQEARHCGKRLTRLVSQDNPFGPLVYKTLMDALEEEMGERRRRMSVRAIDCTDED